MSVTVNYRFKVAGYNAGTWTAGTLLEMRELGFELDTGKVKLGDGATTWGSLGYHHFWTTWSRIDSKPVNLTAIEGLSTASDKLTYWTGSGTATLTDLTSFGRSLIDDADAAAARTTMGLAAVASSGSASDLTTGTLANARLASAIVRSNLEATSTTDPVVIPANSAIRLRRVDTLLVDIIATGGSDGSRTISIGSGSGDYGSGTTSIYGANTVAVVFSSSSANFSRDIHRAGTKVVGTRVTGWAAATGTPTRTTFATSTVTTTQLAERVKALIDDLIAHGLIGT